MEPWPVVVTVDAHRSLPALGRIREINDLPYGAKNVSHAGRFARFFAKPDWHRFEVLALPGPTIEGVL
jgi:hypothetical protein